MSMSHFGMAELLSSALNDLEVGDDGATLQTSEAEENASFSEFDLLREGEWYTVVVRKR